MKLYVSAIQTRGRVAVSLPLVHVRSLLVVEAVKDIALATLVQLSLGGISQDTDDEDESRMNSVLFRHRAQLWHQENTQLQSIDHIYRHAALHALDIRPLVYHDAGVAHKTIDSVEIRRHFLNEALDRR